MKNKDDGSEQLLPKWSISELFLELLDPTTRKFTFQTYTDRKSKRLSCDVAARTTPGAPWPGGRQNTPRREPASVIMLNAEDALDSVVVPRLKAAFVSHF